MTHAPTRRRRLLQQAGGLTAVMATGWTPARLLAADDALPVADRWPDIHRAFFGGAPIADATEAQLTLLAPKRADDAAVVPITIQTQLPQSGQPHLRKVWLVIDHNPSPVGAVFTFGEAAARAELETRVRVEEYTHVRAVGELSDGKLVMVTRFMKASGGCSAPAGKDLQEAMARLGRMKLTVPDQVRAGEPAVGQLMVSHPNTSGLAIDQLTRLYPTPRFVRRIDISLDGVPVLGADVDFTLSENPHLRFAFTPRRDGVLKAVVTDTESATFTVQTPVKTAA